MALPSYADILIGKVVQISDGDTLTILTSDKQPIKVRLNAIDAPEKAQDFGNASKKSLSSLCFGKPALIDLQGTDKYGRTIVALQCQTMDGSYHDANLHQVQNGMAWVYRQGSSDKQLIAAEESAKASSIGLWSQPDPIPPWEFRNGNAKIAKKSTQVVQDASATSKAGLACAGKRFCKQMASCAEARFYLNVCGVSQLDRNNDGIPCESICR